MKDSITLIKRISAEWIVYNFSELSIEMFKKQEYWCDIEITVKVNGHPRTLIVKLSAWDIQTVSYYSGHRATTLFAMWISDYEGRNCNAW